MTTTKLFHTFLHIAALTPGAAQSFYAMEINSKAPVKYQAEIIISANPDTVWNILCALEKWPEWNKRIAYAHPNEPLAAGSTFRWKSNGSKIRSTIRTLAPARALAWEGKTFGGSAIHSWRLETAPEGTKVQVAESMQGWLVGLFKGYMQKLLESDMRDWLEQLKNAAEANKG